MDGALDGNAPSTIGEFPAKSVLNRADLRHNDPHVGRRHRVRPGTRHRRRPRGVRPARRQGAGACGASAEPGAVQGCDGPDETAAARRADDRRHRPRPVTGRRAADDMKVVWSPRHAGHNPVSEIEHGAASRRRESVLSGSIDPRQRSPLTPERFEFAGPTAHGVGPIEAVHDPGWCASSNERGRSCTTCWGLRWSRRRSSARSVARGHGPDARRATRRDVPGAAGPVVLGDEHAAGRAHVRRGARRRGRGARPRPIWCSPANSRVRAVPTRRPPRRLRRVRRLLLLQQRRGRRAESCAAPGATRHGPRRRLPPRQRHAADLLRRGRRAVRLAARRPAACLPVLHAASPRRPAPAAAAAHNLNVPLPARLPDEGYLSTLADAAGADRPVRSRRRRRLARRRHVLRTIRSRTSA